MSSSSPSPNLILLDTFKDRSPVLFDGNNRIPAIEDVRNVLIYICFATLFIAFLIIFPGIRKERLSTFVYVTVSLLLGTVILSSLFGTNWHVAEATISSPYRAFSREKIYAKVVVRVGMQSVNISLQALARFQNAHSEEINFNERFYWIDPLEMKQEHKKALSKGLPFPILTIAEYLSQDEEGFCWGRRYRLSGYFASISLWAAFCSWILMLVFMCAVPRYAVYTMQVTGMLMLLSNAIYAVLLPAKPLVIPFENQVLSFHYGWCFWFILFGGILGVAVGASLLMIDIMFPHKFSTILEIDYDTPYRYFVGNDAHLLGHSNCPHESASPMSSSATDSTCCGNSHNSRRQSRNLRKMKSDASTSTTMSIPIKRSSACDLNDNRPISSSTSSTLTQTATVKLENVNNNNNISAGGNNNNNSTSSQLLPPSQGFTNAAFDAEEGVETDRDGCRIIVSSSNNNEDAESEDSDVSTTIIDGKRAISLHNFGKFTAQQQQLKRGISHQEKSSSSSHIRTTQSGSGVPLFLQQHSSPSGQLNPMSGGSIPSSPTAGSAVITLAPASSSSASPSRRTSNQSHHLQLDLTSNPAGLW